MSNQDSLRDGSHVQSLLVANRERTETRALVADEDGSLITRALGSIGKSLFANRGANATLNVVVGASHLLSLSCYNSNASARFLQIHKTATTPAPGAVPVFSFLVPTQFQTLIGTDFFGEEGFELDTGFAFAFSTTRDSYTAAAAADQSTQIIYRT